MKYPNSEQLALDDVSFVIDSGQTVLVVGELIAVTNNYPRANNI
jgi:hypothetical protein